MGGRSDRRNERLAELARGELRPYEAAGRLRPPGRTAYRMAKVADGSAHAYVSAGPNPEWDVCAGALIEEEAGGRASQIDGRALRFNQPVPRLDGVVATNGEAIPPAPPAARAAAGPREEDGTMTAALLIGGAAAALGVGIWIGIGAPGWPHEERYTRRHGEQRSINPIAWGRTPSRQRQRPRTRDERRGPKLR